MVQYKTPCSFSSIDFKGRLGSGLEPQTSKLSRNRFTTSFFCQKIRWNQCSETVPFISVTSLHPDSKWLHIGCDEVYQLAQCPICSERVTKARKEGDNTPISDGKLLFLDHVRRLGQYVREKKKIIPIIWDDMLRNIPLNVLQVTTYRLLSKVFVLKGCWWCSGRLARLRHKNSADNQT